MYQLETRFARIIACGICHGGQSFKNRGDTLEAARIIHHTWYVLIVSRYCLLHAPVFSKKKRWDCPRRPTYYATAASLTFFGGSIAVVLLFLVGFRPSQRCGHVYFLLLFWLSPWVSLFFLPAPLCSLSAVCCLAWVWVWVCACVCVTGQVWVGGCNGGWSDRSKDDGRISICGTFFAGSYMIYSEIQTLINHNCLHICTLYYSC